VWRAAAGDTIVRRVALLVLLLVAVVAGGGVAVGRSLPSLVAGGPVSVTGTEATGVFTVAERTVRQVRYADAGTLRYTFALTNDGRLPVRVLGLASTQDDPRLFDLVGVSATELAPGETVPVTLRLRMNGCESLSSRAGSFVSEVRLRTRQAEVFDGVVAVALPEEIHTGSPREASCPEATATSRPQG
jgi:hypothetical protein